MILDTLNHTFNLEHEPEAYIIAVKGNDVSEKKAIQCIESCEKVKQKWYVWEAFSVENNKLVYPEHAIGQDHYKLIKKIKPNITPTEMANLFSHYSLWCHCMKIDKPIIILEHDAVMCQKYTQHKGWNEICYLGCFVEYEKKTWAFPPTCMRFENLFYINKTHAYAIDPAAARSLASHAIKFGITSATDVLMRIDLFNITQRGQFAYEVEDGQSIIRKNEETNLC